MPYKPGGGGGYGYTMSGSTAILFTTGGSGTHEDPFRGMYFNDVGAWNAASVTMPIPMSGSETGYMRVLSLRIYISGTNPGVLVKPLVGVYGTGASNDSAPIAEPQVTVYAADTLAWDNIGHTIMFAYGTELGRPDQGQPYVSLTTSNYAATDSMWVQMELEWVL